MLQLEPVRALATRRWASGAMTLLCVAACAVDSRTPATTDDDEGFSSGRGGAQSGSAVTGGTSGTSLPASAGGTSLPVSAGGSYGSVTPSPSAGTGGLGTGGAGGAGSGGSAAGASGAAAGAGASTAGAGGSAAPGTPPAAPAGPCGLRLAGAAAVTFDDLYSAVALDLSALGADAALSARYLALTNRQSTGAPTCELDADSRLLLEVLSSLTVDPTAPGPVRLAGTPIIYRIDLRALNWTVAVTLRGTDFSDTWEAIIASSPFATPFLGDDADDATADSGTTVPVLLVDALLDQMLVGVPPFPPGVLDTLQADPELLPSLDRVSTPVDAGDVAGDLGVTQRELLDNLNLLDPALAVLGDNGTLERAVYAPLYRDALCILALVNENQPDPFACP